MDEVKPQRRWSLDPRSPRALQAAATRETLVAVARTLFAERGYHAVSVRDIAAKAGVTRGALAHHFSGKEALFEAAFDAVEQDLIAESAAGRQAPSELDPWARFRAGLQHYLDAATRPEVQRITLIDGPAVLGWKRWRELEEGYSLGGLVSVLRGAMDAGLIRPRPVEPLAHLVLGSIMEAALMIANADHPARRRAEVGEALDDLLRGLE
jgi:AcrR family transcriptional regulator